ncbi:MAG: DUF3634 family protein [Nannocystaceae bacterium]|nr:DUF3634 family protein [Nannocystaceae bacterium]
MHILVIAGLGLAGYLVVTRLNEIFCLSVRNTQVLLVRGHIPTPLLLDLQDIMRRAQVEQATIRAVKGSGHARIVVSGTDDGTAQRCRNAFGNHPIQQLRARSVPAGARNLGQTLGIAWLAWLLTPRR